VIAVTTVDHQPTRPGSDGKCPTPEQNHRATEQPQWGSDAVVDLMRAAEIPWISLNPGASFRGLHDSLVNYADERGPQMLVCLHEEHAVALAHGWAKVSGLPMAVALHSNVGLMHASMAIYNAWCDRVPMLIIGATGPLDAASRRPWIDWIHTSADQPAIVRNFVKWDDTPTSVPATLESIARAWDIARTAPTGPTYVVLDASVQEAPLTEPPDLPVLTCGAMVDQPTASADSVARAVDLLSNAAAPVVLVGPAGRDDAAYARRVQLVEALNARAVTDLKAGSLYPMRHPAHVPGPGFFLGVEARRLLREADVVLSLNWIDLAGTLAQAEVGPSTRVVSATLDPLLANGWSKDHQARPHVDVWLPAEPDAAVSALLTSLGAGGRAAALDESAPPAPDWTPGPVTLTELSRALQAELAGTATTLVRLPLGWDGNDWAFGHPLDFLGYDGGGGIGSGPGMAVGAALALRDSDRLPVAVLGDGDYLMGVQALWTAAHQRIPLLLVVANNRSYFNDEVHQERVAHQRGRDASRKWVGQRIDDPPPDLAGLARAQGVQGIGPVSDRAVLGAALAAAVAQLRAGHPVVVDVVVETGYTPAMAAGVTRGH
jgi:thiamine pyrophosphate-dependent acetolactate synthase large subunit-like protein